MLIAQFCLISYGKHTFNIKYNRQVRNYNVKRQKYRIL